MTVFDRIRAILAHAVVRRPGVVWRSGGATHPGNVRERNEDAFFEAADAELWAVADGRGGHDAGDVAAREVVERLAATPATGAIDQASDAVRTALKQANDNLRKLADERGPNAIIGATVVALVARGGRAFCFWAGDSRLYRLRSGALQQLTEDHAAAQELHLASGDAASEHAAPAIGANVITRAVGAFDALVLSDVAADVEPDDVFLLCSDGLYRDVSPAMITQFLADDDPARAAERLVNAAIEAGGRDNVTAVVAQARRR